MISPIAPPTNTQIWIAAGVTDMRRGFTGLSALVQTALEQVYSAGKILTRDVGGTSGTRAFADAVIAAMYS